MASCWMECFQPATGDRVSAVRRQFLAWLGPMSVPEEVAAELALALTEACSNAVEHGSPRGERDTFHVWCRCEEEKLVLEVRDHGRGFCFRGVTRPDPLAERGRGIWLMAAVTDRIEFRQETGGTRVHLEKDIARHLGAGMITAG